MIAASVIVENFFPPSPSDVFVVLAAFLSHRGAIDPVTIFLVAWGFSVAGAVAVYAAARHFGRRFLDTPLGRRVVTPAGFAAIEREYLRFGAGGIFFTRLLPGFRTFVAPFAGFVSLPPLRALLPIVAASGLWFGGLTWLGSTVGAEWETIRSVLSRLNRGLGIAALALAVLLLGWWLLRRRRRARESLWDAIHLAFVDDRDVEAEVERDPALAGAATLLIELARGEVELAEADLETIRDQVRERWHVEPRILPRPRAGPGDPSLRAEVSRVVAARYGLRSRRRIVARLGRLLGAHDRLADHRTRLLERAAELLAVPPEDGAG